MGGARRSALLAAAVALLSVVQAECEIPRNASRAEICEYVRAPVNECESDGWFPFLECFYCWVDSTAAQVGVFILFLVWVCLLLYVLATTADMYFAPATVQLSDWLGLRPRVAGVTLLALGNGAPDVFSVMAAYRAGQGDLAVGALVGGSMFVTTVVVGAVITASGGSVKAAGMFVRDIMFNLIGSTLLFFMCWSERATLYEAGGLFGMYLVYVVAVTQGHRFPPMLRADRVAWYAKREEDAATVSEKTPLLSDKGIDNLRESISGTSAAASERERRASIQDRGGSPVLSNAPEVVSDESVDDSSCCGSLRRRLIIASEWDELDGWERASFCFEAIMHFFRGLTIPVIPEDDELSGDNWNTAFQRLRAVCAIPGFFAWMSLYIQRRIQDVDSETGGPAGSGSDLLSSTGPEFIFIGGMPMSVFFLVIMLPWCGVVWVLTENGMPRWLRQAFVLPAFISSIAWFDVGADELVEVLRAFGYILDVPIAVLGVTVLAWGNSVSDLLGCRAIARQGHAKMAISGCYGEPIFNRFFGVALSYAIITLPTFPEPYTAGIFIDASLAVCFGFQTLALLVSLAAGMLDGYRIRAWLGWVLIGIYCIFMVVVVVAILFLPSDWRL